MGVEFKILPSTIKYFCKQCKTYLSNNYHIRSRDFVASSGQAYLFDKVFNCKRSVTSRICAMTTGYHIIRDIFCNNCDKKIGWFYEMALENTQEYKEGMTILESVCIQKEVKIRAGH